MRIPLLLFALALVGCAGALDQTITVVNTVNAAASSYQRSLTTAYVGADNACLWKPDSSPVDSTAAEIRACRARAEASYGTAARAYEAFYAGALVLAQALRIAQAAEAAGATPDLVQLEQLASEAARLEAAFLDAYNALSAPAAPRQGSSAPIPSSPTSPAPAASKGPTS